MKSAAPSRRQGSSSSERNKVSKSDSRSSRRQSSIARAANGISMEPSSPQPQSNRQRELSMDPPHLSSSQHLDSAPTPNGLPGAHSKDNISSDSPRRQIKYPLNFLPSRPAVASSEVQRQHANDVDINPLDLSRRSSASPIDNGSKTPVDTDSRNRIDQSTYQMQNLRGISRQRRGGFYDGSMRGSRGSLRGNNRFQNNDQSRGRNGMSSSTSSHFPTMQQYPQQQQYYSYGQEYYMPPTSAYNPYAYNGYMPYGYPSYVSGYPYYTADGMPMSPTTTPNFGKPQPNNPHLLLDPPMDETSYWVLGQVEYYLSENNLAKDIFLREQVS